MNISLSVSARIIRELLMQIHDTRAGFPEHFRLGIVNAWEYLADQRILEAELPFDVRGLITGRILGMDAPIHGARPILEHRAFGIRVDIWSLNPGINRGGSL